MMKEIELKAWVDDPERVKNALSGLGSGETAFEKEDTYWKAPPGSFPGLPPSGIRIRRETERRDGGESRRVLVTYKTGEIRNKIEVNEEREFGVSGEGPLEELLGLLGLRPAVKKHKRGWAWTCGSTGGNAGEPPVLAELSELRGLGWFIELEIRREEGDDTVLARCRTRLLSLLAETGVGEEKIETRPYTAMVSASNASK
jgi:predicted adenylyl cyclase CyaB